MIKDDEIPKYPNHVHIEITTKCNLRCIFCPINRLKRGNRRLSDKEVLNLIEHAAVFDLEYIDFVNYGETLLHPKFFLFAAVANRILGRGKLGLVTNGTVMNENVATSFIELGFKQLVFSLDGFTKEIFEKVRVGADRNKIYEGVNWYLEFLRENHITNYFPVVAMTVCKENEQDVQTFWNYWNTRPVIPQVYRCTGRGGEVPLTKPNSNPCRIALDGMWILNDGRVTVCCEDVHGINTVGSIYEQSLSRIWEGDAFQDFRSKHLERRKGEIPLCKDCQVSQDSVDYNKYMLP